MLITNLTLGLMLLEDSFSDLFYNASPSKEQSNQFEKLLALHRLYIRFIEGGEDGFDWVVAHKNGWLSVRDYTIFATELNGLTPEMYNKE